MREILVFIDYDMMLMQAVSMKVDVEINLEINLLLNYPSHSSKILAIRLNCLSL